MFGDEPEEKSATQQAKAAVTRRAGGRRRPKATSAATRLFGPEPEETSAGKGLREATVAAGGGMVTSTDVVGATLFGAEPEEDAPRARRVPSVSSSSQPKGLQKMKTLFADEGPEPIAEIDNDSSSSSADVSKDEVGPPTLNLDWSGLLKVAEQNFLSPKSTVEIRKRPYDNSNRLEKASGGRPKHVLKNHGLDEERLTRLVAQKTCD